MIRKLKKKRNLSSCAGCQYWQNKRQCFQNDYWELLLRIYDIGNCFAILTTIRQVNYTSNRGKQVNAPDFHCNDGKLLLDKMNNLQILPKPHIYIRTSWGRSSPVLWLVFPSSDEHSPNGERSTYSENKNRLESSMTLQYKKCHIHLFQPSRSQLWSKLHWS